MERKTDICCIGHITRDRIITPQNDVQMPGGTAYYMARGIRQLGGDVRFQLVTKVGNESLPVITELRQANVEVLVHHCPHTVYFVNKYGENSNNRTQRVLAQAEPFTLSEVEPLQARIFHLGSLLASDFSTEVVEHLAQRGEVSIDVQGYLREVREQKVCAVAWPNMKQILTHTTYLKLNEHEMQTIANTQDPIQVAQTIGKMGVREVIITLGSYGSVIWSEGRIHTIPSFAPKKLVDATGCGDTYSTGYLWMRTQGASCEEAGRFAAALCTLKLEHNGPFDGSLADVQRVLSAAQS